MYSSVAFVFNASLYGVGMVLVVINLVNFCRNKGYKKKVNMFAMATTLTLATMGTCSAIISYFIPRVEVFSVVDPNFLIIEEVRAASGLCGFISAYFWSMTGLELLVIIMNRKNAVKKIPMIKYGITLIFLAVMAVAIYGIAIRESQGRNLVFWPAISVFLQTTIMILVIRELKKVTMVVDLKDNPAEIMRRRLLFCAQFNLVANILAIFLVSLSSADGLQDFIVPRMWNPSLWLTAVLLWYLVFLLFNYFLLHVKTVVLQSNASRNSKSVKATSTIGNANSHEVKN